jgi:hypothetical protein
MSPIRLARIDLEPAYVGYGHAPLPAAERLTASSAILPLFHEFTEEEQGALLSVMRGVVGQTNVTTPSVSRMSSPTPRGSLAEVL